LKIQVNLKVEYLGYGVTHIYSCIMGSTSGVANTHRKVVNTGAWQDNLAINADKHRVGKMQTQPVA
jgi:hypothetical protein